jgi:mannan endo-1,4-beta-mannosidase
VAYKEDPTILAWNLINEPRCETWVNPDCPNHLHDWLASMAAYVRSLDARHLITYGSEGFFGPGPNQGLNPYVWMADLGQDWVRNNQIPDLDYASLHVWPENWGVGEGDQEAQVAFVHDWVLSHLQVAQEQLGGKLVMLEEFGKKMPIDPLSDSRLGEWPAGGSVLATPYHWST